MARRSPLRPAGFDDLGLKRALSDRLLPALVAAMTFLAALTLAGALAAGAMAAHWREGAGAVLTVQVPRPQAAAGDGTRLDRAVALLRGTPGVIAARVLPEAELADLLRPWLGTAVGPGAPALPLPAVIEVHLAPGSGQPPDTLPDTLTDTLTNTLAARLQAAAPGSALESHGVWLRRLSTLAHSLEACALAMLLLVTGVAAAVVAVATRAGLAARRDAIEIVHGLGASDDYIATRFARRATLLTAAGACLGAAAALPVLLALAGLAAPFSAGAPSGLAEMPRPLWLMLPALPAAAAVIGWLTTQLTVRRWLWRLP